MTTTSPAPSLPLLPLTLPAALRLAAAHLPLTPRLPPGKAGPPMTTTSPAPSLPILPLTLAAAIGLAAANLLLTPPLVALAQDQMRVAAGAWFFGPATLAGIAFLVGGVRLSEAREAPALLQDYRAAIAALSAPLLLGLFSIFNTPARFRPVTWLTESATLGLMLGLGLALSAIFWQGLSQHRLFGSLPALLRAILIAALSLLPPAAFLLHSETSQTMRTELLPEIALSLAALALLHEAGLTHRVVAFNALVLGVGVGVLNHAHVI